MSYTLFSDEYFMNEALKQAQLAFEADEVPIGAVIVCQNKIIAKARATSKKKAEEKASQRAYFALQEKINKK